MVAPQQLSMREAALAAHDAGLCVVPPREDGSKAPISRWKEYQAERPLRPQVESWYGSRTGLGIECGEVSGGLELFEFDDAETYRHYKEIAKATGLGDLAARGGVPGALRLGRRWVISRKALDARLEGKASD